MTNNNEQSPTGGSPSNRYIACCGNDCTECPLYQKDCSEGCLGTAPANYCLTCAVRLCSLEKEFANCGYCEKYPCEILIKQYESMKSDGYGEWASSARAILDEIHNNLQ